MATVSKVYKSKRWQAVRAQVLKRDGGRCYFCGKLIHDHATVHHLQEVNELNYLNDNVVYNIDNLVACHRECHNRHHGRFGKPDIVDRDLNIDYRGLRNR